MSQPCYFPDAKRFRAKVSNSQNCNGDGEEASSETTRREQPLSGCGNPPEPEVPVGGEAINKLTRKEEKLAKTRNASRRIHETGRKKRAAAQHNEEGRSAMNQTMRSGRKCGVTPRNLVLRVKATKWREHCFLDMTTPLPHPSIAAMNHRSSEKRESVLTLSWAKERVALL